METLIALGLGSLKALLLLVLASGIALALRGRPARIRAVIWATALVGSLLIPLVSPVVPVLPVEIPIELPHITGESLPATTSEIRKTVAAGVPISISDSVADPLSMPGAVRSQALPSPEIMVLSIWSAIALLLLVRQGVGLVQMQRIIGRARPVTDSRWLALFDGVRRQIGCHRKTDLVITSEIDIPSVFGIIRPVVVLPEQARVWLPDRLEAVLQHETVHVVRFDWPLRIAARVARSIYWFNPLAWWAAQRLDLEQEMACDEEVLSLGSRASSYACHLLGIARTAVPSPAVATAGIAMARRSHLEERIMRILNRSTHRRVGLAVILPAVLLTAALVPALASVQPAEPAASPRTVEPAKPASPAKPVEPTKPVSPAKAVEPVKPASPALKAAVAEMEEAEARIEPYLERVDDVHIDMQPIIERIEAIEIDIDEEAIARIESEMAPILAQIDDIKIDMEPYHEQMEAMHEKLETMTFHIDDGTLQEVQEQIQAQMETLQVDLADMHIDMSAYHELTAQLHTELAPLQEKIARLTTEETAKIREQMKHTEEYMELEREQMEHMHAEMARIHEEMAPLHEEMELIGARIEGALVSDVADVLRSHLGPVSSPSAPYREAAARIIDEGNININNGAVKLYASRPEVREILSDLFSNGRVGTQDAFDIALNNAVDEVSDLRIALD